MAPTYHVRLKDADGTMVAVLDQWISLAYEKRVNAPGGYTLVMSGSDSRTALFELDGQVEVWRADLAAGIGWYLDFEAFHRAEAHEYLANGEYRYTSQGRGYADLLARRIIAASALSAGATKTGVAETVIKAFVNEQAGPGAGLRACTGLSISLSLATGSTITMSREYRNLLEVCQEIANAGRGDFAVVGNGVAGYQFRWYSGQLGTDRTVGNAAGNPPVVFSPTLGNMRTPRYALNRADEVNVVYVGGQGVAGARTIAIRTDPAAIGASTWNRREVFRNASNEAAVGGLNSKGDVFLDSQQAREEFTFVVVQVPSCLYGREYNVGDLVTVRFGSVERDKKVISAQIGVAASSGQIETIGVELADV